MKCKNVSTVKTGRPCIISQTHKGLNFKRLTGALVAMLFILSIQAAEHQSPDVKSSYGKKSEDSKPVIAILGSSLAVGWVTSRETKFDMKNGWAFRLERLLASRGFETVNISKPGDTTQKVLDRLEKDLFPLKPDFVIISLSLENEGIRGIQGKIPAQVYNEFKTNLKNIVNRCRERKIVPVMASCYPSDNYTEDKHYNYIKDMNLELAGWDVPGINLMGALDNGHGGFVDGVTFDLDHPDSQGHEELFYSIVPGLFEALSQAIPLPSIDSTSGYFPLEKSRHPAPLSFHPDDPLHSFTLSFEVRPESSGILASLQTLEGDFSRIQWRAKDKAFIYQPGEGKPQVLSSRPAKEDGWFHITLSHRYLKRETQIFVNGRSAEVIKESIIPVHLVLGGPGDKDSDVLPLTADFRNWMIYRSALNELEASALSEGHLLQPSLELFSPLAEEISTGPFFLKNLAQSTSRASAFPHSWEDHILSLKNKIAEIARSEKIFVDPNEKEAVPIEPKDLDELTGDFFVDENLTLTVAREKNRLFLLFNHGDMGKTELFPSQQATFSFTSLDPKQRRNSSRIRLEQSQRLGSQSAKIPWLGKNPPSIPADHSRPGCG